MDYVLERITTEFSVLEDRVRLVCQVHAHDPIVIWITRRLLSLMMPSLLSHVSISVCAHPAQLGSAAASVAARAVEYEDMCHEFAQFSANELLTPIASVKADQGSKSVLPSAVDFKVSDKILVLVFRADDGTMATLAFDDVQLRQWLQILHKSVEGEGGWRLLQWPAWLSGESLSKAPQGLAIH